MKVVKDIKQFHHFQVSSDHPGVVFAKEYKDSQPVQMQMKRPLRHVSVLNIISNLIAVHVCVYVENDRIIFKLVLFRVSRKLFLLVTF